MGWVADLITRRWVAGLLALLALLGAGAAIGVVGAGTQPDTATASLPLDSDSRDAAELGPSCPRRRARPRRPLRP